MSTDLFTLAKNLRDAALVLDPEAIQKAVEAFDAWDATGESQEIADAMALHDLSRPEAITYLQVCRRRGFNWRDGELIPLRDADGNVSFYESFNSIANAFDAWVRYHGAAWEWGRHYQLLKIEDLHTHGAEQGDTVVYAEVSDSITRSRYVRDLDFVIEKARELGMDKLEAMNFWRTKRDTVPMQTITSAIGIYRAHESPDPRFNMSRYDYARRRAQRRAILTRCPFADMIKEVKAPEEHRIIQANPDIATMEQWAKDALFAANKKAMGRRENNPNDLL